MVIQGNLACYNPTDGGSVYVLCEPDTNRTLVSHNCAFLSFAGVQYMQRAPERTDEWATLVLQVDVASLSDLSFFSKKGFRRKLRGVKSEWYTAKKYLTNIDWVWPILMSIGTGFTSKAGERFVAGKLNRSVYKNFILASDICTLSDNIISVVEEYEGLPKDGNWIRIPEYKLSPLMGGNLYTTVAHLCGIETKIVKRILSAIATTIADVSAQALIAGASAVDVYIPYLGTFSVTYGDGRGGCFFSNTFSPDNAIRNSLNIAYGSLLEDRNHAE